MPQKIKQKRATPVQLENHIREWGILYMHGGNPAIAAGLFDSSGRRIAWWPAAIKPEPEVIEKVVMGMVWTREDEDKPILRNEIIQFLAKEKIPVEIERDEAGKQYFDRYIAGDR